MSNDNASAVPLGDSFGLEHFNRALLESVGVGIAIVDPTSLVVLFHNQRLQEYVVDIKAGVPIDRCIELPDISDIKPGEVTVGETTIKVKRRSISLALHLSLHDSEGRQVLLIECHNISKVRELESMIDSYSKLVEKNQRELRREKERAERLLLNIMPRSVYEELKSFGVTTPQRYDEASVVMLDFIDFSEMAIMNDPTALISELNDIFTAFDRIVEQFGCERIKTIGDAYVAVAGVPESTPDHMFDIAHVALRFRRYIQQRNKQRDQKWNCRIGIATGPLIGSIVGVQKYVYDIFGPAANLAARLESVCDPMEICLTGDMAEALKADFRMEEKGVFDLKGFGSVDVFHLLGGDEEAPTPRF